MNTYTHVTWQCTKHPTYTGVRPPNTDCAACKEIYSSKNRVLMLPRKLKNKIRR